MTEQKWLHFSDTDDVFDYLQKHQFSERKARLFAVACCRTLDPWISESVCRVAVDRSEQFADGQISRQALGASRKDFPAEKRFRLRSESEHRGFTGALELLPPSTRMAVWSASWDACHYCVRADAWDAARYCLLAAAVAHEHATSREERAGLFRGVLHDIFGNPFRRVAFDSHWRTSDVVGMARAIYEDKAFDRIPILADALMDAGCSDEQVLGHCRGDGPHVRGCWVVDLVLEKS
jgi:hypothetical protein